jgi:hypothetical protein
VASTGTFFSMSAREFTVTEDEQPISQLRYEFRDWCDHQHGLPRMSNAILQDSTDRHNADRIEFTGERSSSNKLFGPQAGPMRVRLFFFGRLTNKSLTGFWTSEAQKIQQCINTVRQICDIDFKQRTRCGEIFLERDIGWQPGFVRQINATSRRVLRPDGIGTDVPNRHIPFGGGLHAGN